MADDATIHWPKDWGIGLRLWIEQAGEPVLGPGRLQLLEGIERHHSISAAARQMGMSYRHAWQMIQRINQAAGVLLVTAETGGLSGGGARLTEPGRWVVTHFRELRKRVRQIASANLTRLAQDPAAEPVHIAAAVSLEDVLRQLLDDYALLRPATRLRAVYGASDELADQILAGAPADVMLAAEPGQLDRLLTAGLIDPASRTQFAGNGLAAIAAPGFTASVRSPAGLVRVAARVALAAPSCPLGSYTRGYLQALGLFKSLSARSMSADDSRGVVAAVRSGRADIGLVYRSDADRAGCRLLFHAGRGAPAIRLEGAVVRRGRQADEAGRFLHFLVAPAAARRFRAFGFGPVRRR